ncbi:MAG: DUF72 domain-containing protein [Archangiaceae bacterium]|nr:DUF72 domain-containing protein [Archangiaceae bacterium]
MGTSGWRYPEWRRDFYPVGLPQRRELEYVAQRVSSVELNGSFYSLQRPEYYRRWAAETPPGFVFAVKGSRYITHMKKLRDVKVPLANFFASGPLALGEKLGPLLWQFPEVMPLDERFAAFFDLLPRDTDEAGKLARHHDARVNGRCALRSPHPQPLQHAVEIRSLCAPGFIELLRERGIGLVVADTAGRFPCAEAVTSKLVYVRLHGETELYGGGYAPESIARWAAKLKRWAKQADVYAYFDNDRHGRAPFDAVALQDAVEGRARAAARWSQIHEPPTVQRRHQDLKHFSMGPRKRRVA